MRLIDADTLVKDLSYLYTKNHIPVDMRAKEILTTIMEQSTAYDIDKVIEELDMARTNNNGLKFELIPFDKVVEIVKQGGVGKDVG